MDHMMDFQHESTRTREAFTLNILMHKHAILSYFSEVTAIASADIAEKINRIYSLFKTL